MKSELAGMISVAVLGLALGATTASADTVTYSDTFGSSGSPLAIPINTTATLTKFDTSLGTLTGVQLKLVTNATVTATVYNFGSSPANFSNVIGKTTVTATGPNGTTTTNTIMVGPYSGIAAPFPPGVVAGTDSGTDSQTTTVLPVNWGAYQGSGGGTFNVLLGGTTSASGTADQPAAYGATGTAYGTVSVTYTFTPVPEPSSLALIGLGLAGGTVSLYRRKVRNG
ncbi:MAG TPA: choice-of-anchor E domain-containing protein [Isosphaeraceae bacterium]|nr:choice-of-anchor E domain-containing protein [Isosphaeraceae bacterium]